VSLRSTIQDREWDKFVATEDGATSVRVTGENFSGTFTPSGLTTGGRISEVVLNDTGWTPLPSSALPNRNAIAIQNLSGIQIKINYDSSVLTYTGIVIASGSERSYDITDDIILYAKSASGTPTVTVEEIA
jgi:hypothetical protein